MSKVKYTYDGRSHEQFSIFANGVRIETPDIVRLLNGYEEVTQITFELDRVEEKLQRLEVLKARVKSCKQLEAVVKQLQ